MCFTAFSVVSMVTAVVSIQLLRLGMVNHTTDGHTFQKEHQDPLIYVALSVAGLEILVCLVSVLLSCRMAKVAKEEMSKQRDGMFHVKVLGQKDIVVVTRPSPGQDREELTAVWVRVGKGEKGGEQKGGFGPCWEIRNEDRCIHLALSYPPVLIVSPPPQSFTLLCWW